jgi:hypothetical protein
LFLEFSGCLLLHPRMKKPAQRGRRRASELFDLSGRLHQAITVRRHGVSMMMVVTVMAVALHLNQTIKETRRGVNHGAKLFIKTIPRPQPCASHLPAPECSPRKQNW